MQNIRQMAPGRVAIFLAVALLAAVALLVAMPHAADAASFVTLATVPFVAPSPFSGLLPAELADKEKRAYMAPLEWLALAAGAAAPVQLVADNNHDFIVTRIVYVARDAAAAIVDRPLFLTDWSLVNGVSFTPLNFPVELEAIAGSNRGLNEFMIPLVIPAGETLTVQGRNGTAAVLNVRLTLIGFRSARARR